MPSLLDIGNRAGMAHGASLYNAAGQIIYSTASGTTAALAAGSASGVMYATGSAPAWSAAGTGGQSLTLSGTTPTWTAPGMRARPGPTGCLAETFPRSMIPINQTSMLTSGTILLTAIALQKGQLVSSASFYAGTTALGTGTHQYFSLHDSTLARVALSADDTSTAWGTNTKKTLSFTSAFTVVTTGLHYIGLLVTASIVPTLYGQNEASSVVQSDTPIGCGTADTGVSAIPNPVAALSIQGKVPYAFVS